MKYSSLSVPFTLTALLFLSSCTLGAQTETPANSTNQSYVDTGALTPSTIENIKVDLTANYSYLDSDTKTYATATFGDIISKTPYTIVYFYPKDGTPNCTIQALDFSRLREEFEKKGYQIIGVSKDNLDSHKAFAERNELRIKLLQDDGWKLLSQFGALGPLQEYGNGSDKSDIIRSTFVIDNKGNPVHAWRDIQAVGHAERILATIQ